MRIKRLVPIGGGLYVQMRRPSLFRDAWGFASLYFGIVFDLGPITAAKVAWIVHGDYAERMRCWRAGKRIDSPGVSQE